MTAVNFFLQQQQQHHLFIRSYSSIHLYVQLKEHNLSQRWEQTWAWQFQCLGIYMYVCVCDWSFKVWSHTFIISASCLLRGRFSIEQIHSSFIARGCACTSTTSAQHSRLHSWFKQSITEALATCFMGFAAVLCHFKKHQEAERRTNTNTSFGLLSKAQLCLKSPHAAFKSLTKGDRNREVALGWKFNPKTTTSELFKLHIKFPLSSRSDQGNSFKRGEDNFNILTSECPSTL